MRLELMDATGGKSVKKYDGRHMKDIPGPISDVLDSIRDYDRGLYGIGGSHEGVLGKLEGDKPFSIIIFSQLLASEHWRDKKYVKSSRYEMVSELDEVLFRHFNNRITERMSEYKASGHEFSDEKLEEIVNEFKPEARAILRADFQEMYPRSWRKKFTTKRITSTRVKMRRERLYVLPPPLDSWDPRNHFQQYYILPEQGAIATGGSGSSGQRENHSVYGYGFALFNQKRKIETHIFIYDRHNDLRYVDSLDRLCLVRDDLGSNYHIRHEKERTILRGSYLCLAHGIFDI